MKGDDAFPLLRAHRVAPLGALPPLPPSPSSPPLLAAAPNSPIPLSQKPKAKNHKAY